MVINSGSEYLSNEESLARNLINRIYTGVYPPGSRMPDREVIRKELNASMTILQAAIDQLQEFETIFSRKRIGTFVSEHPQCFSHIGIHFPDAIQRHAGILSEAVSSNPFSNPMDPRSHFVNEVQFSIRAAMDEFLKRNSAKSTRPPPQVSSSTPIAALGPRITAKETLLRIRLGYYAAHVLPVETNSMWSKTLIRLQPDRPWIGFGHWFQPHSTEHFMLDHMIAFRWDRFLQRALKVLIENGRRNLTMIHYGGPGAELPRLWRKSLAEAGLPVSDFSVIPATEHAPHMMHMILGLANKYLPQPLDGCVVADENMLHDALEALQYLGVAIPRDMAVVSQSTFPPDSLGGTAVHKIGYSLREAFAIIYRIAAAHHTPNRIPRQAHELQLCESGKDFIDLTPQEMESAAAAAGEAAVSGDQEQKAAT